jgi:hypothetical protein
MPPVPGGLSGIAARSSRSAVAIGFTDLGDLVARWNGTAWKTLSSPALPPASFLAGVAVFRGGAWVVGQQDMSGDGDPLVGLPLMVRVTGTAMRQVPGPPAPDGSALQAVAATSATDAWAVGSISASGPLVWHWNGTTWKNVPLPPAIVRVVGAVRSVAATSKKNVWLVSLGRIVHWNGRRWNVVSPNIGRPYDLFGVAAMSARNVFAVGSTRRRGLMLHWTGRRWRCALTTPKLPFPEGSPVVAVSASSADNAWAVGYFKAATLALHWNGHTWKQFMTPQAGQGDLLQDVAVIPGSGRAWAVGDTTDVGTLMLHWNGTAWH